ncbi:MAG: YcaQ family DNA glycosylase [Candidatus Cloacimonetes bacterium]|nr:YcaQ family DNA glycosylase [Candidatus Cloacimonadota bacterium]
MLVPASVLPSGKQGIIQIIDRLGYIQIDTISVIKRAHHHTLWTRKEDYCAQQLHELQSQDRLIFEYWGHAASYLPMTDYRFYLPRMKAFAEGRYSWAEQIRKKHSAVIKSVWERIKCEGPLSSKDFANPEDAERGPWWGWKPAKTALELLFWQGELMVTERKNFQRYYDLTARVLPDWVDRTYPHEEEMGRFLIRKSIAANGVVTASDIKDYLPGSEKKVIFSCLNAMQEEEEIVRIGLNPGKEKEYFTFPHLLESCENKRSRDKLIHILSPFDNLIILRKRTESLLGFNYALECYLPPRKRTYGYFVLPVLYGDKLVARLDAKADRRTRILVLKKVFLEPEMLAADTVLPKFVNKLGKFALFNECDEIIMEDVIPAKYRGPLENLLKGNL